LDVDLAVAIFLVSIERTLTVFFSSYNPELNKLPYLFSFGFLDGFDSFKKGM